MPERGSVFYPLSKLPCDTAAHVEGRTRRGAMPADDMHFVDGDVVRRLSGGRRRGGLIRVELNDALYSLRADVAAHIRCRIES